MAPVLRQRLGGVMNLFASVGIDDFFKVGIVAAVNAHETLNPSTTFAPEARTQKEFQEGLAFPRRSTFTSHTRLGCDGSPTLHAMGALRGAAVRTRLVCVCALHSRATAGTLDFDQWLRTPT